MVPGTRPRMTDAQWLGRRAERRFEGLVEEQGHGAIRPQPDIAGWDFIVQPYRQGEAQPGHFAVQVKGLSRVVVRRGVDYEPGMLGFAVDLPARTLAQLGAYPYPAYVAVYVAPLDRFYVRRVQDVCDVLDADDATWRLQTKRRVSFRDGDQLTADRLAAMAEDARAWFEERTEVAKRVEHMEAVLGPAANSTGVTAGPPGAFLGGLAMQGAAAGVALPDVVAALYVLERAAGLCSMYRFRMGQLLRPCDDVLLDDWLPLSLAELAQQLCAVEPDARAAADLLGLPAEHGVGSLEGEQPEDGLPLAGWVPPSALHAAEDATAAVRARYGGLGVTARRTGLTRVTVAAAGTRLLVSFDAWGQHLSRRLVAGLRDRLRDDSYRAIYVPLEKQYHLDRVLDLAVGRGHGASPQLLFGPLALVLARVDLELLNLLGVAADGAQGGGTPTTFGFLKAVPADQPAAIVEAVKWRALLVHAVEVRRRFDAGRPTWFVWTRVDTHEVVGLCRPADALVAAARGFEALRRFRVSHGVFARGG